MKLTGKGYYIWIVQRSERGDPDQIAALAREANLSHVLIKIADGAFPYNMDLNRSYDFARPVIKKLQAQNIAVWGWQYVYGNYPQQEAEIAVKRALELGVDGFTVNAEKEYRDQRKAAAASRYMSILRNHLGSMPIALSSYRYPMVHHQFPWTSFLERCDYNMPQVYWMQTHGMAAQQLKRCVNEFKNIRPYRPIVPTGPTFKEHGWVPRLEDLQEFMDTAKQMNIPAVNFWFWEGCRRDLPAFWDFVKDYDYQSPSQETSLPTAYINAINSRNPEEVIKVYAENAVHIRPQSFIQGKEAIRNWVKYLLDQYPDCVFSLVNESNQRNIQNFQWEASDNSGTVVEGRDTIGLVDNKIRYHYSFMKTT